MRTGLLVLVISFGLSAHAQKAATKYDAIVNFTSMCCGTVPDSDLRNFVKKFNKKNRVTVRGYKVTGCGKEGEYKILFKLTGMSNIIKKRFTSNLQMEVDTENEKTKSAGKNLGPLSLEYNKQKSELITGCRNGIVAW